ncbi:hypothetical protein F7725_001399 [Dissostichus mawsoni]|uniref:CST complex subunit CTC1 n=1 Tax=Dissostichus mawsoni TaxID=36200 RepID=A0A7J5ZH56_DISMA|nr:hypothetical protein F7725_001399 [Dissostichus mawsoni]
MSSPIISRHGDENNKLLLNVSPASLAPRLDSLSGPGLQLRGGVFSGSVTDRISVTERSRGSPAGVCAGVRLTVCDQSGRSLQVYLELSHTPYPPGLLPGNTLLLSAFQRRVSRSGGVYCSQLPVSSLTVTSLGDSSCVRPPPAPMMHLGVWTGSREQRCIVVGSERSVWILLVCLSVHSEVRALLGLADSQWEGLQRALRVRGHIRVYPRGRSLSDSASEAHLYTHSTLTDLTCTHLYTPVHTSTLTDLTCTHLYTPVHTSTLTDLTCTHLYTPQL